MCIYVPARAEKQQRYFEALANSHPQLTFKVSQLPTDLRSRDLFQLLRKHPGLLALQVRENNSRLEPVQYIVPGQRFNELYGWDSYFCVLGLLEAGKLDVALDIAEHFIFEIEHYGAVLNANRSYYLGRSQPPFLTDLLLRIYARMSCPSRAREFLWKGTQAAIKEYHEVWMCAPRLDPVTGLSRYRPDGFGIPPEVESGHYDWYLGEVAQRLGTNIADLSSEYNEGILQDEALDEFFMHDRASREAGHDTSYEYCEYFRRESLADFLIERAWSHKLPTLLLWT